MKRRRTKEKLPSPPGVYDVDPEKDFPQEWHCLNVMCRAMFWREFGESEFCPSCRKCVGGK